MKYFHLIQALHAYIILAIFIACLSAGLYYLNTTLIIKPLLTEVTNTLTNIGDLL